jgi:F-type H+-transporting ATPase subunit delta
MSVQRIATRYAKSLIEIAQEKGKLDRVMEDVRSFREVAKNKDFYLLIKSPIIKSDKKAKIFKQLFEGKYDSLTLSFLNVLLSKGREKYLADVANEFIDQYREIRQISTVRLTTASKLSDVHVQEIIMKLKATDVVFKNVELETSVKPGLIGGFIIEFHNCLYDASLAHKLDLLRKEFKDNLYISQIIAS